MNLEHAFVASARARKRALRRRWTEIKLAEYRWWREVSKEAFNTGLDGLGFWSFTVEVERAVGVAGRPAHIEASAYPVVGVDLGVKTLATCALLTAPSSTNCRTPEHSPTPARSGVSPNCVRDVGSESQASDSPNAPTPTSVADWSSTATSTPHDHALDETGTAPPQGKAA